MEPLPSIPEFVGKWFLDKYERASRRAVQKKDVYAAFLAENPVYSFASRTEFALWLRAAIPDIKSTTGRVVYWSGWKPKGTD